MNDTTSAIAANIGAPIIGITASFVASTPPRVKISM